MEAEFIEPTPGARRKLALLFVAALVGGALLIERVEAYLAQLRSRPVCDAIGPLSILVAAGLGVLLLCAAWVAWIAVRALKSGQWPLPGTWVFRRTPIKRGRVVAWRAYGMLAWAALVAAAVVHASHVSWRLGHSVGARCGLPAGLRALERTAGPHEIWTVRRESWLPPFPVAGRYERDRDAAGRAED